MGFKKGRISKSEADRRIRRRKSSSKVHSYAITSIMLEDPYVVIPPKEGIDLEPFWLRRVFPPAHTTNVIEKFESMDDYGKFAPFRDRTFCELVTDEKDWMEFYDLDGVKFRGLSDEAKVEVIHRVAKAIILMIRLRGMPQFIVPMAIHGSSFSDLKDSPDSSIKVSFPFPTQCLIFPSPMPQIPYFLEQEDIDWIRRYHRNVMRMNEEGGLEFLFDLFSILNFPSPEVYKYLG